jgi:CubicO group peptidase (beta-lactamase class C family)
MKNRICTALIFFLIFDFAVAQNEVPSFISDSLDSYVERALTNWQIPGVALLVVRNGQVVVQKGYGYLEMDKPEKVDENTLFMIASNTKAFTGTAMCMLETEGKCSLDDRVQKYLPGFTMKDPWVAQHLTLADVMSHRIGMETFQGDFMYWESDLSSDEVIEKFGMLTPMYDFRTKWGYCNAGFLVAGECLEKISGEP